MMGSKLTCPDLSGSLHGHFMLVGWMKNNAAEYWRMPPSEGMTELLLLSTLVYSSEDFIVILLDATIIRLGAALLFLAMTML